MKLLFLALQILLFFLSLLFNNKYKFQIMAEVMSVILGLNIQYNQVWKTFSISL